MTENEINAIAAAAMEQVLADEALYDGLDDRESTILAQWANGRIGLALSGVTDEVVARRAVMREPDRLIAAFAAIARQTAMFGPDNRGMMIAAATAILSELWNAGK